MLRPPALENDCHGFVRPLTTTAVAWCGARCTSDTHRALCPYRWGRCDAPLRQVEGVRSVAPLLVATVHAYAEDAARVPSGGPERAPPGGGPPSAPWRGGLDEAAAAAAGGGGGVSLSGGSEVAQAEASEAMAEALTLAAVELVRGRCRS